MTESEFSFAKRLWFAILCFFRVLFNPGYAFRLSQSTEPGPLPAPEAPEAPVADVPAVRSHESALLLLSALQREGRLIDFLAQDLGNFDDADIGATARVVHDGCAKALRAHVSIVPVRSEPEGESVSIPAGFDASSVKLLGNVQGSGPYKGLLRHHGWRATSLDLPTVVGDHDAFVLAPAEVEL